MFWYVYLTPTLESNIESNDLWSLLQVNCACLCTLHNAVIIRLVIGCVAGFLLLGDTYWTASCKHFANVTVYAVLQQQQVIN